MLIKCDVCS